MGAYFKVYEGGAYSKEQYFVFFTAVFNRLLVPDHFTTLRSKGFKEFTWNNCPYKHMAGIPKSGSQEPKVEPRIQDAQVGL